MKLTTWCAVGGLLALAACSAAQPVALSDADLNAMLANGAQAQFAAGDKKGVLTFFGDKTVSREIGGSGQIDDGTWRVSGGQLCITWKSPAAPEACMTQVKVGSSYEARAADGSTVMAYTLAN